MLAAQSCPTPCNPVDCNPPGSCVHGILQARILEWVAISFSRGPSRHRDWTQVSYTAGRFFTDWASSSLLYDFMISLNKDMASISLSLECRFCVLLLVLGCFSRLATNRGLRNPLCISAFSPTLLWLPREDSKASQPEDETYGSAEAFAEQLSQVTSGHIRESPIKVSRAKQPSHSWATEAWVSLARVRRPCPGDLQTHEQNEGLSF